MNHPNCLPTAGMRSVCAAAERAARRNDSWTTKSSRIVHGVRGKKHRRVKRFNVTFGGGTLQMYLTAGAVLMQEGPDGLTPVELAQFDDRQYSVIRCALDAIGR